MAMQHSDFGARYQQVMNRHRRLCGNALDGQCGSAHIAETERRNNAMTHESMKVGQVVMLASGGPKMTVLKIDKLEDKVRHEISCGVTCEWFSRL